MDVDALPDTAASGPDLTDPDEKPDLPALAAGELRAAQDRVRYTKEGKRILKEYPIYFTTELSEYLTLLQYPHRWRESPMNSATVPLVPKTQEDKPIHARMKPNVNALEISVPIEGPSCLSYSRAKGEEMGRGVEAGDLGGPQPSTSRKKVQVEDAKPLERMTFRAEPLADQTNYCAGVLTNDGLHLTPLLSTMQMRASLTYLDRNKARERERKARGGADDADEQTANSESDEEENEDEFEAKKKKLNTEQKPETHALTVSLRPETAISAGDKGVGRATAALFAPRHAENQEPWVNLQYFGQKTDEANIVAGGLLCRDTDAILQVLTRTSDHLTSIT